MSGNRLSLFISLSSALFWYISRACKNMVGNVHLQALKVSFSKCLFNIVHADLCIHFGLPHYPAFWLWLFQWYVLVIQLTPWVSPSPHDLMELWQRDIRTMFLIPLASPWHSGTENIIENLCRICFIFFKILAISFNPCCKFIITNLHIYTVM